MQYKLMFNKGVQDLALSELKETIEDLKIDTIQSNAIIFQTMVPFENIKTTLHLFTRIENVTTGFTAVMSSESWRKAAVPAGVHPSIAHAMCQYAKIQNDSIILDPFCGAGTIPIIAKRYFNPKMVIASDKSGNAMDKLALNLQAAAITKGFMSFRSDIRRLKLGKESVNRIVTNMPFGIRVDSHKENERTYMDFAEKCGKILMKDGILVALTQEIKLFSQFFDHSPLLFQKVQQIPLETGGLKPLIYIYKKL